MTTTEAAACPKCGGNMWDNRATKTNPKQPDFKCKDRGCDGVIWPPRNGAANGNRVAAAVAAPAPAPVSLGAPLPYETPYAAPTPSAPVQSVDQFVSMATLYARCMDTALATAKNTGVMALGGDVAGAVAAMGATLFIGAKDRGIR